MADNRANSSVKNDQSFDSFISKNIGVLIGGQIRSFPQKYLVYPFSVTKVSLNVSKQLPSPNGAPSFFPNFPILYDQVDKDDFQMYSSTTGLFTVPLAGWWKISYTTTLMLQYPAGTPFNTGRIQLNGYVKKNNTSKHVLSSAEVSLIHNNSTFDTPAQEFTSVQNSDLVFFDVGDSFNINGRMLGAYDSTITTNRIYMMGNPGVYDDPPGPTLNAPATDLTSGFDTLTTCSVQFVRPKKFPNILPL